MKKAIVFAAMVLLFACSKDEEDPIEENELDCTSITVTYTTGIEAIIASNCAVSGCHDGSTSLPNFTSYDGVFTRRSSIRSRVVSGNMPPSGRDDLTRSQIDQISCWVENGAPQ